MALSNQMSQITSGFTIPKVPGQRNGFPTLSEIEKHHILAALEHCKNNRTHAARLLDVSIRTLRNKLHEYKNIGLKFDESKLIAGV
jgi:DNA-binding NtrC family response regulator